MVEENFTGSDFDFASVNTPPGATQTSRARHTIGRLKSFLMAQSLLN